MTKVYGKDKHFKWHYGRLGGFLEDGEKQVHGITCRHVTKAAHNGSIYIKDQYDEYIEFGKTINRCKTYEIIEDIDLILINEYMLCSCDTTIRNSKNGICTFDIYEGPAGALFGQSVFMRCLSSDVPIPKIVPCRIAAANVYHMFKGGIDVDKVFIVESSELLKPGESGNLLLMENSDGTSVYLLGILLGAKTVKLENTFEAQLSEFVNSRNEKLESIPCETTDQKCFLECMIGCKYLYSGDFEQSDEHLKDAVRLISKTSCRNRLLCKLVTYSTWQLLQLGQLENMRDLLKEGEDYMLQMNECNACPLKSIGYHYFDYARYYKRIQNNGGAMCMARKSLRYFELDEKYRGRPSHGKCFALSMIARLNLQCGDKFETRHMAILNLNEAQECVSDMKCFENDLPAVEKATYYLVKTDLHYRRGEMEKAKTSASKCFHLAQQNDLKQEQEESEIRIRELVLLCNSHEK